MLQLLSPQTQPVVDDSFATIDNSIIQVNKNDPTSFSKPTQAQATPTDDDDNDMLVDDQVALFHRHEIKVGELAGSGSFSQVFDIFHIKLDPNPLQTKSRFFPSSFTSSFSSSNKRLSSEQNQQRNSVLEEHETNMLEQIKGQSPHARYVLKALDPKLLKDHRLFRRAVRDMDTEATLMRQLDHSHIVSLRGVSFSDANSLLEANDGTCDSFFLILDRLHETLDDRMTRWNQEKEQQGPSFYTDMTAIQNRLALKVNYAAQIASALEYLHQKRIIFRDLKPQNIGFKTVHPNHPEEDVLAVFDFGLARKLPSPDAANEEGLFRMSMVGTRRYMAPEVVLTRTYDLKADVYSFGMIFYELISQTRPYENIQRAEHKEFICRQGKRPKIYDYYNLPLELETMLRHAWAQDLSKRLTMIEICATLKSFLKGTIHEQAVQDNNTECNNTNNTDGFIEANKENHVTAVSAQPESPRRAFATTRTNLNDSYHTTTTEKTASTTGHSTSTLSTVEDHKQQLMDVIIDDNNEAAASVTRKRSLSLSPNPPTIRQELALSSAVPQDIQVSAIPEGGSSHGSDLSAACPPRCYSNSPSRRMSMCGRLCLFFRYGSSHPPQP